MNVAVVGLGRVGLPLALSFADRGLDVIGVEREQAVLEQVAAGPACPTARPAPRSCSSACSRRAGFKRTRTVQDAAGADHIVLTLGTPAHVHIEIDMSQIKQVVDDLLPVLREGQSLILRSTVAPGTTDWVAGYIEQRRGFRVGEDLFVAHVPERIAENHFLEEIATLPCIVGGVGEGSGAKAAELFEVFGAEIVQTTPVQAELAKIWTNILRYTQFALPNLLMMEAEQYGANVFDVIDLINRDYPRGGIAQPGPDRRRLPAQGLHVLRGALERARHAAGRLARARDRAAVPRQGAQGAAGRLAARPQGRRARAHLQARLRRPARLALLQARAPAGARAGPRRPPRPARVAPDPTRSTPRSTAPRPWWSPPTTRASRTCSTACPTACCSWIPGT